MKRSFALVLLWLVVAVGTICAADKESAEAKRLKKLNATHEWLTNEFAPWLTNKFPTITFEHWPDWFVDPPSHHRLPTWLTNTFPQIDTEDFPFWLNRPVEEELARGIPDFWNDVKTKVRTVPQLKLLPVITRGPYLQLGTTNSMVVRWRTALPHSSAVKFGRAPDHLSHEARSSGTLTDHAVQFTNLNPGARYFYSIGERAVPILVWLTNDVARLGTTNGVLYVGSSKTNLEIAAVTNGTFTFFQEHGHLSLRSENGKFLRQTTNQTLLVSTLTDLLRLSVSNGEFSVTTSNSIIPLDGGAAGGLTTRPTRHFAVGSTNLTFVGADADTFFVSHPPTGAREPVRVWIPGNPGASRPAQRALRDAFERWNRRTGGRPADLGLRLGDNAFPAGRDSEYQEGFFDMFAAMLRQTVVWPCLGREDRASASASTQSGVYFDIFTLPTQGQAGGVMSGTEAYYSWDYANIHFIALDSSESDSSVNGYMLRWLKADLEANRQDWLVAFCHDAPGTSGSADADAESDAHRRNLREIVLPLLERHGLDLMLSSRGSAYERSFLIDDWSGHRAKAGGRPALRNVRATRANTPSVYVKAAHGPGAVHVITGFPGLTGEDGLPPSAVCVSVDVPGSLVLDFDGPRLDANLIDDRAEVRDHFTIQKSGRAK